LLLVSAFRRVLLYEAAYGFTVSRLYAQVYMVVMGAALVMLGNQLRRRLDGPRLARRSAAVALGAFTTLAYWNHEAWVARQNLERFAGTGKLDVRYLTHSLSPNAVPALVDALRSLPELDAGQMRACLELRHGESGVGPVSHRERWFEWNLRRVQADRALRRVGIVPTPIPDVAAPAQRTTAQVLETTCNGATRDRTSAPRPAVRADSAVARADSAGTRADSAVVRIDSAVSLRDSLAGRAPRPR
jgi:hypothetical protein